MSRCVTGSSLSLALLQTQTYLPDALVPPPPLQGPFQTPAQPREVVPGSEKHLLPQRGWPRSTGKAARRERLGCARGRAPRPLSTAARGWELPAPMGSAGPPAPSNSWGRGVTEDPLGATKVRPQRERWPLCPRGGGFPGWEHARASGDTSSRGARSPEATQFSRAPTHGQGNARVSGSGPEESSGCVGVLCAGVRPCCPLRRPTRKPEATPVPTTKA